MPNSLVSILTSPFTQIILFAIMLVVFIKLRKDPRLVVSGVKSLRTLALVVIFFYFMFVWVSAINDALRNISIFLMFVINLFMAYNLLLASLERPYRDALAEMSRAPDKHELIHNGWSKGKKFYYFRHFWAAVFSSTNPFHFLHDMATDRVREDIKTTLRQYGVEQKIISLSMMAGYLKSEIACDETMPGDFKEVMVKAIDDFVQHPWIQEHANKFLTLAIERPEDLHFPEWMAKFETCVKTYKSKEPV
jgi:hypothetical protein